MRGPASFIWIATLCFPLYIISENIDGENRDLLPSNLRVKMGKTLGVLNLTWDCNVTEDMLKHQYEVKIRLHTDENRLPKSLTLQDCYTEIADDMELHKGIWLQVVIKNATHRINIGREIHYVPEGKNGSAAENVSCVVYNTSSMNCTFTVGHEAPNDTQYHLSLRRRGQTEDCYHYIKDAVGRNIICQFHDLTIDFNEKTYLIVGGSSKLSQIQLFDEFFMPSQTERITPPRNITVLPGLNHLILKWVKPKTNYQTAADCFEFEISIQSKESERTYTLRTSTDYRVNGFDIHKTYTLKMRARQAIEAFCGMNTEWGEWSTAVYFGDPPGFHYTLPAVLISVGITLIALVTIVISKRHQIRQKMFPPIPDPKRGFQDLDTRYDTGLLNESTEHGSVMGKCEPDEALLTFIEEHS
ncbi:interleukin-5 receptor subunit alpha-like [Ambystoma mexicanum]|uniref:interleukin-5 receptor subunit alpha-like n=1 Tax=Ambystoma mexicanum TaxID=8296 RepID=UPI0037E8B68E